MNKDLNEKQNEAVDFLDGAVLVSAGAGTGKTRVLTYRVAHLINDCNIAPENILAITFTNKAANEMKERIASLCKNGELVWVSTFHSLCARILREHIWNLDSRYNKFFTILNDSDSSKIIKKIVKENYPNETADFEKKVNFFISKAKNDAILPSEFCQEYMFVKDNKEIADIFARYENELIASNSLDFDDLILKTIKLFNANKQILELYQNRFKYIHVDEFQDTNKPQYELVKLLSGKYKNVFIVGDEDQSIYAFRGANYKNLNNFKKDFNNVKVVKLELNYRSTKPILDRANKLINKNVERSESKNLTAQIQGGDEIVYKVLENDYKESDYIASQIEREHSLGTPYKNIAVLFRINAISRGLENSLVENGIPYRIFGGLKFYERAEIKNLLAYLRLIVNPKDNEAFTKIVNFPKRGVGDATIKKLDEVSKQNNLSMLEYVLNNEFPHAGVKDFAHFFDEFLNEIKDKQLNEIANTLVKMLDVNSIYKNATEEDENRLLNIRSFISGVNDFCENNENANLVDFLENVNLDSSPNETDDDDVVILSTVHGVKGLEFDVVYIMGFEENMMPYKRSVEEGNIEEERRLSYVAITRAKRKLTLTRAKTRFTFGGGYSCATQKSRFINEMEIKGDYEEEFNSAYGENQQFYKPKTSYVQRSYLQKEDDGNYSNEKQSIAEFLGRLGEIRKASDVFKAQQEKNKNLSFRVGTKLRHARFGEGIIKELNGKNAIVEFANSQKELNLDFAPVEILEV